jgi:outer membrane protein assembly factor BamB
MKTLLLVRGVLSAGLILMTAGLPAVAFEPGVVKLLSPARVAPESNQFGLSVAISDRYVLVADRGNDDVVNGGGAVQVYDAKTGRWLRKLSPSDVTGNLVFGRSVAVSGDLALVGSPEDDAVAINSGAAYVFDLRTGRQMDKLKANDAAANDRFGERVAFSGETGVISAPGDGAGLGSVYVFTINQTVRQQQPAKLTPSNLSPTSTFGLAVALAGRLALVGAPGDSVNGGSAGAAYVFDTVTGQELWRRTPSDPAAGDRFGEGVALSGHRAVVGAPFNDQGVANGGAAYVFDVRTGAQLRKLRAPDAITQEALGLSLAVAGNHVLAGAPAENAGAGAVHVFDATTGERLRRLTAVDGQFDDKFGSAVGLAAGRAVVGASSDGDLGTNSGSAYLFRPLAVTLPGTVLAQTGSFAPGSPDAVFGSFQSAFLNGQGEVAFEATLGGSGASGGRNRGMWTTLAAGSPVYLGLRTRDGLDALGGTFVGTRAATVSGTLINRPERALLQATLAGTGVTAKNNRALLVDDGTEVTPLLRTGSPPPGLAGTALGGWQEVLQDSGLGGEAVGVRYDLVRGTGGVDATNDSGVLVLKHAGGLLDATLRAGNAPPVGGGTFGAFSPRICLSMAASPGSAFLGYGAFVVPAGGGAAVAKQFVRDILGPINVESGVAGGVAPDTGGALFRTFLAQTMAGTMMLHRATLTGTGTDGSNNEAIFRLNQNLLIRKGTEIAQGVTISRFIQFFGVGELTQQVIALVRLAGAKVNASNDQAVVFRQSDGVLLVLMREGDVVEGDDVARIGSIQRLVVDSTASGQYAILASLTGSAARNQGFFSGSAVVGNTTTLSTLRRPRLVLRKGTLFQSPGSGTATALRSLSLTPVVDAAGAGDKGLGQSVRNGSAILQAEFDSRARLLFRLRL